MFYTDVGTIVRSRFAVRYTPLNISRLEGIKDVVMNGTPIEPIKLREENGVHAVYDGYHRLVAFKVLQIPMIPAVLTEISGTDAMIESYNGSTDIDKAGMCRLANHLFNAGMSMRDVSEIIGINTKTIRKMIIIARLLSPSLKPHLGFRSKLNIQVAYSLCRLRDHHDQNRMYILLLQRRRGIKNDYVIELIQESTAVIREIPKTIGPLPDNPEPMPITQQYTEDMLAIRDYVNLSTIEISIKYGVVVKLTRGSILKMLNNEDEGDTQSVQQ